MGYGDNHTLMMNVFLHIISLNSLNFTSRIGSKRDTGVKKCIKSSSNFEENKLHINNYNGSALMSFYIYIRKWSEKIFQLKSSSCFL